MIPGTKLHASKEAGPARHTKASIRHGGPETLFFRHRCNGNNVRNSITSTKMKGIVIKSVGAPWKVVEDLEVPKPSDNQILVKSIATAINPVLVHVLSPLSYPRPLAGHKTDRILLYKVIHICSPLDSL